MNIVRSRSRKAGAAVVVVAVVAALTALSTSAFAADPPRIGLDPVSGVPGTQVTVTGEGFVASSSATDVGLYWSSLDGGFLGAVPVRDDGTLEATVVTIPEGEPGSYDIVAAQNDGAGQAVEGTPVRAAFQLQRAEGSGQTVTGGGSTTTGSTDRTTTRTGGTTDRSGRDTSTSTSTSRTGTNDTASNSGAASSRSGSGSSAVGSAAGTSQGSVTTGITGGSLPAGYAGFSGSGAPGTVSSGSGTFRRGTRVRPPGTSSGRGGNVVVAAPASPPAPVATGAPPVTSEDLWSSLDTAERPSLQAATAGAVVEDRARLAAGVALLAAGVVALAGGALAAVSRRRRVAAESD